MDWPHTHCESCVNRRCSATFCKVTSCAMACGAMFHACKLEEHALLCPLERVPCLNRASGCKMLLPRARIATHLPACPASVVRCSMEWNRWPVREEDRSKGENVPAGEQQLDMALALQDQRTFLSSLELISAATVSRAAEADPPPREEEGESEERMEEVKEGALPSTSKETLVNGISALKDDHLEELYQTAVQTTRSLAAALNILINTHNLHTQASGIQSQALEPSDSAAFVMQDDCRHGDTEDWTAGMKDAHVVSGSEAANANSLINYNSDNKDLSVLGAGLQQDLISANQPIIAAAANSDSHFHQSARLAVTNRESQNSNMVAHVDVSPPDDESDAVEATEYHNSSAPWEVTARRPVFAVPFIAGQSGVYAWRRQLQPFLPSRLLPRPTAAKEDKATDTSELGAWLPRDPLRLSDLDGVTLALMLACVEGESALGRGVSATEFTLGGVHCHTACQTHALPAGVLASATAVGEVASASACDRATSRVCEPSQFCTLRLPVHTHRHTYARAPHITREGAMFTFECGHLLRRDEFAWHFRNVHGDLHAGLSGWVEQRCPLAAYGCSYSQRRLCPPRASVVHDPHLRAFGVRPHLSAATPTHDQDYLSSLPSELLRHLARYLDGFSLCQLSQVSRTLRATCASLLPTHGMVVVRWERQRRTDGTYTWQVRDKIWRFSTAFSPVERWAFSDAPSLANHLQSCPFNTVERHLEAVALPCMGTQRQLTRHNLRPVS
ncbi:F-box only protein 30b [Denticeps clupeoides]|uniref:F-box only protein 30 n=1 Tax=Denticeps clupeoides TaxID=299321 RepID=A0AAY4ECT5_9TELE|nr:F-box only protein 30 [Denticeps clupeoides]XP_028858332.1 F-box only protein 30 [Denticeps clupeoides]XP_028858333.1 F-box only protein 30 [Denticeps clupeoides]